MASKILAKLILSTTTLFSKIFLSAYKQALNNAKTNGSGGTVNHSITSFRKKMKPDEAMKILNIEKLNKDILEQQYKKFFESNDPKKGGSFYLQSKIYRAKE
eukprot:gene20940-27141_t